MFVPPKYFSLQEYIPESVFLAKGQRAWQLLDERLLRTDFELRKKFGPVIINTWHSKRLQDVAARRYVELGFPHWDPVRDASGLRVPGSQYYSPTSQHSFGRASDKIFLDVLADEVIEYIKKHPNEFPYLTSFELGVPWLHSDCRNAAQFYTYYPTK